MPETCTDIYDNNLNFCIKLVPLVIFIYDAQLQNNLKSTINFSSGTTVYCLSGLNASHLRTYINVLRYCTSYEYNISFLHPKMFLRFRDKGKGKIHPRIDHEGAEV